MARTTKISEVEKATLKAAQDVLYKEMNDASLALKDFPKQANGLTPDEVKFSAEFQAKKQAYNAAFQSVRNFNAKYAKFLR